MMGMHEDMAGSAVAIAQNMISPAAYKQGDIADVKQCTLEGDPDHILAARFLMGEMRGI